MVGLAVARALAMSGHEVVVMESQRQFGTGVSSRNSEVIHAGLYYQRGSLKGRLCVRGKAMLYAYCAARGVAHRRCGKLLVATRQADEDKLRAIAAHAAANGVDDLRWLSRSEAQALEPALHCTAALHSPSSGIVDSHALMTALLGDAENAGALLAVNSAFIGAFKSAHGSDDAWVLRVGGDADFEMSARWIVNCAGLSAQSVAANMQGFARAAIPQRHLAKGHYFALSTRAPFTHLIYPTPVDGGLGVHLTLDMTGRVRFGPDVQWLASGDECGGDDGLLNDTTLDYSVDAARAAAFEAEIRRYWPALPEGALHADSSGIRPKLSGPGEPAADFRIDGPREHGCARAVQLFGIESPGLTSALAIGEHVLAIVEARPQ